MKLLGVLALAHSAYAQKKMEMKLHHTVDESNFSFGQTGSELGKGVLMVRINNGDWGTVCSIGFNQAAADIVCSKIGFKRAVRFGPNLLDGTLTEIEDKKILVQDVTCYGGEQSLIECGAVAASDQCDHNKDISIQCTDEEPTGECISYQKVIENQGAVFPGQYQPRCNLDGTFFKKQCDSNSRNCWCSTPEGEKIPGTSVSFNYVEDMARMECETDDNGSFRSDTGEGVVRLRNSNKKSRKGVVSIFHRGEWGFICRDQVDSKLTNVICRQLGFDRAGPIAALRQAPQMKAFLPKYEPSMMATPILCEGNEDKISMCSQSTWALPTNIPCEKDAAVMLQCENISEAEKNMMESRKKFARIDSVRASLNDYMRKFQEAEQTVYPPSFYPTLISWNNEAQAALEEFRQLNQTTAYDMFANYFNVVVKEYMSNIKLPEAPVVPGEVAPQLEVPANIPQCYPGTKWSSCTGHCQKQCRVPLYNPSFCTRRCVPGCICEDPAEWLRPDGSCSKECEFFNPQLQQARANVIQNNEIINNIVENTQQSVGIKGGITCPDGLIFSQCKSHCQVKCGDEDKENVCDESVCMPGCVCPEGEFMWANGKACSSICLKPTQAPEKPKTCIDIMPDCPSFVEKCNDLISGPTLQTACAFTCKNKDACGDFFEPKKPSSTPAPAKIEPKATCKDLYPDQCQLEMFKKRCDPVKHTTFALRFCRKSCGHCDGPEFKPMKTFSKDTKPATGVADPEPTCVDTMQPAYLCENLRDNCLTIENVKTACRKTCGLCEQPLPSQTVATAVEAAAQTINAPTSAPQFYIPTTPAPFQPQTAQPAPMIYQPPQQSQNQILSSGITASIVSGNNYQAQQTNSYQANAYRAPQPPQAQNPQYPQYPVTQAPDPCFDVVVNCADLIKGGSNFCMYPTLQQNCRKSCGICQPAPVVTIPPMPSFIATAPTTMRTTTTMKTLPAVLPTKPTLNCISSRLGGQSNIAMYLSCNADGSYAPKQCNPVQRSCWCVFPDGLEVVRTRSKFDQRHFYKMDQMECTKNVLGLYESNFDGRDFIEQEIEILSACQAEYKNNIILPRGNARLPSCEDNGDYSEIQCSQDTGSTVSECWCSEKDGSEKENTRKMLQGNPELARTQMDCREKVLIQGPCAERIAMIRQRTSVTPYGQFYSYRGQASVPMLPKCNERGFFLPLQCDTNNCWCVTPIGDELAGTRVRTRGMFSRPAPNCDALLNGPCLEAQMSLGETKSCDRSGFFNEVQCPVGGGACICVDKNTGEPNGRKVYRGYFGASYVCVAQQMNSVVNMFGR